MAAKPPASAAPSALPAIVAETREAGPEYWDAAASGGPVEAPVTEASAESPSLQEDVSDVHSAFDAGTGAGDAAALTAHKSEPSEVNTIPVQTGDAGVTPASSALLAHADILDAYTIRRASTTSGPPS